MKSDFLRFEPHEFRLFTDKNGEPKIIEIQDLNQDHLDLDLEAALAFELNKISGKTK